VRGIAISVSVGLSVCLSVCLSARISQYPHAQISPNFLYFSTSGFVDDVMFSHNEANGSESKTTRMLRPVRYVAASGMKSAVSDCIMLQLLIQSHC